MLGTRRLMPGAAAGLVLALLAPGCSPQNQRPEEPRVASPESGEAEQPQPGSAEQAQPEKPQPAGQAAKRGEYKQDSRLVVQDVLLGKPRAGIDGKTVVASPDGRRVAYALHRGDACSMVVGDEVGRSCDGFGAGPPVFSPDGKRVAYAAKQSDRCFVVVDGKHGEAYEGIGAVVFSPDSRRVAYVAARFGRQLVVVDGEEGGEYDGIGEGCPVFSPDSSRVAYVAADGWKQFVVTDGDEGKKYEGIRNGTLLFSPDGKHVAYAIKRGAKNCVVVDGEERKEYKAVHSLVFSPDSKRVAYAAHRDDRWFVVVGSEEGQRCDAIGKGSLVFSPDGSRIAFSKKRGDKCFIVVGDEEGKGYDAFRSPAVFSPDGTRVAYVPIDGGRDVVVLDGEEVERYDGILSPVFSPDGKHLAYKATRRGKWVVVVDAIETWEYDGFLNGAKLVFDRPNFLHTVALREVQGVEFLRVEVEIVDVIDRSQVVSREDATSEITLDLGGGVTMELVLIPAGEFVMGSSEEEIDSLIEGAQNSLDIRGTGTYEVEIVGAQPVPNSPSKVKFGSRERLLQLIEMFRAQGPQHEVKISTAFYLGKYEVTQEQWGAVMDGNPSRFRGSRAPVENVGWEDCQTFLRKLNQKFVDSGCKFSLPSEAQWEYACRAGSTTKWCYGDDERRLEMYAWFADNSGSCTHPVGQKEPNVWGLYDMHGNVSEWCADLYGKDYYRRASSVDPTGPRYARKVMPDRVLRGGSYLRGRYAVGSAYRHNAWEELGGFDDIGFRVAMVLAP